MFYLAATNESLSMMRRLAFRMEREGTWDQTAYNEEQFYPAHGTHGAVGVSSRVMNYFCNLNSKTFFRFLREARAPPQLPASPHIASSASPPPPSTVRH